MSEKVIRTITIKAEGDLGIIPDVAGLIQSCVKMHTENGRETGDLFIKDLHVTYSYAEHKVSKKGRKKKGEEAEHACMGLISSEHTADFTGDESGAPFPRQIAVDVSPD